MQLRSSSSSWPEAKSERRLSLQTGTQNTKLTFIHTLLEMLSMNNLQSSTKMFGTTATAKVMSYKYHYKLKFLLSFFKYFLLWHAISLTYAWLSSQRDINGLFLAGLEYFTPKTNTHKLELLKTRILLLIIFYGSRHWIETTLLCQAYCLVSHQISEGLCLWLCGFSESVVTY